MNSTMSSQLTTPAFFLYRATPMNGESFDPTAAIQFFPAKDTDELFDALRAAYPNTKTHSERMRDAVIDFLVKERDAEQVNAQVADTPSTWSFPSNSSSSSNFSSPDLIDLATPASLASPMPSMSRQPSRSSAGRSSMEQMTGVFSLSTNSQPKTRVRRKMTESEKADYRKRRIVKACDKCSKRKRKCEHNQQQMETLTPSGKVTKRKSPTGSSSSFRQTARTPPPSTVFSNDLDPLSFLTDDALFSLEDDFQQPASAETSLNLMDFDFDPQVAQSTTWPWSDTQDWTLMDPQPLRYPANSEPLFGEFSGFGNQQQPLQHRHQNSPEQSHVLDNFASTEPMAATHTFHVHSPTSLSSTSQPLMDMSNNRGGDDGVLHDDGADLNFVGHSSAGQPTRSKRYYGGFERSAFLGDSSNSTAAVSPTTTIQPAPSESQIQTVPGQHATASHVTLSHAKAQTNSGGPALIISREKGKAGFLALSRSETSESPDELHSDLRALRRAAATPSRSAHPGFVVNDKAATPSGTTSNGIVHNEESQIGNSISVLTTTRTQGPIKNKGPEHAARASAVMAGLTGSDASLPIQGSNDGDRGGSSSPHKIGVQQDRHQRPVFTSHLVSAGQSSAEVAPATGSEQGLRLAKASSPFMRGHHLDSFDSWNDHNFAAASHVASAKFTAVHTRSNDTAADDREFDHLLGCNRPVSAPAVASPAGTRSNHPVVDGRESDLLGYSRPVSAPATASPVHTRSSSPAAGGRGNANAPSILTVHSAPTKSPRTAAASLQTQVIGSSRTVSTASGPANGALQAPQPSVGVNGLSWRHGLADPSSRPSPMSTPSASAANSAHLKLSSLPTASASVTATSAPGSSGAATQSAHRSDTPLAHHNPVYRDPGKGQHQQVPNNDNTPMPTQTHVDDNRPYPPLPSGVRVRHGTASLVAGSLFATATATSLGAAANNADAQLAQLVPAQRQRQLAAATGGSGVGAWDMQTAATAAAVLQSGYFVGLATALTGELLKALLTSSSSPTMTTQGSEKRRGAGGELRRGLNAGRLVSCV